MIRHINHVDVEIYPEFKRELKKLPDVVQKNSRQAMRDLLSYPQPKKLRLEKLQGNNKPPIYTIHANPNHSHKISFEIEGDVAIMRKIGTHKEIDRSP